MKLFTKLFGIGSVLVATSCGHMAIALSSPVEQPFVEVKAARTLRLVGEIGQNSLGFANQLMALAEADAKEDINIIINSPGGMVMAGGIILQAMEAVQSRGIKLNCIVPIYAASMAYTIFHQCDRRYAFQNSLLLFHPIRTFLQEPITGRDAQKIADALNPYDEALRTELKKSGLSDKEIEEAYYAEKMWTARELATKAKSGYIILIKDVHGINNIFQVQ